MNPTCHICNNLSPFLLRKDGFNLYKCPECLLVFVYPQPSLDYLRQEVYSYKSGFQSNRAENLSKSTPSRRYRAIYGLMGEIKPKAEILDVGAGGGHFLYGAKKRGFSGVGVELNTRTAQSGRNQGLEILAGTLVEAKEKLGEKKFDIVVMGEIIEHVNDPHDLLNLSSGLIKAGGSILITTPNLDCFWSKSTFILYKAFGVPWSSVTPPYHLFQFSSSNLDLLAKKSGLSLVKEKYVGAPHLKYELGMVHLLRRYKKSRKTEDLVFAVFAYSLYTIIYLVSYLVSPFLKRNFNMIKVYTK